MSDVESARDNLKAALLMAKALSITTNENRRATAQILGELIQNAIEALDD